MEARAFGDLISFSRSTVASYFNATGLLVQAAVNEPRFEYDPSTLLPKGLLLEPQRQNIFTYSQDFSNAVWVKTRTSVTAGQIAPDGTNTAYVIAINDAAGSNYLYRTNVSWVAGTIYTLSIYAKAATSNFVYLQMYPTAFGGTNQVNFELIDNGAFVVTGGGSTGTTARVEKLTNGWYRCTMTATASVTTGPANWIVFSQPSGLGNSYIGWGAQLENGIGSTSLIPTTATVATRNADVAYAEPSTWLKQGEGTLYTEAVTVGAQTFQASLGTTAGSGPRIANWRGNSGQLNSQIVANDLSVSFAATVGTTSNGAVMKQALAFKADDFQAAGNGTVSAVDTSGAVPSILRLSLGARGVSNDILTGHLRKVSYFPYRLSASELQAITS